MTLDSQILRTTGTIYGELMKGSGITLPEGRYISPHSFASGLIQNGIGTQRGKPAIMKDLVHSILYGDDDNILTGVQRIPKKGLTFNPWRELLGDSTGDIQMDSSKSMEQNPRAIVRKMQSTYSLFYRLPTSLRADFLQIVQSYPCEFDAPPYGPLAHYMEIPKLYKDFQRAYDEMKKHVPKDRLNDFNLVLQLIVQHNICVDKGGIVGRQIESLAGHDAKTTPTLWESGHLNPQLIAEKREELTRRLRKK